MKRHIFLYLLLAAGTLSCEKESLFPQVSPAGTETPVPAATGTVSISLGGPFAATRVANPAGSVETTCNRWALWIFDGDGDSVVYGTGLSGESIRKTVLVGSYTVVALVNYPESLVPAEIQRKTDLTGWVTSLSDNAAGSMLMYGEVPVDLEKDRYTVEITVKSRGFFYRTERTSTDLDSAFREAVDLMMRQIVKNKSKLGNRVKVKEVELAGEELDLTAPDETEEEQEYHIAREKRFVIEPMSEQEAILQMNMLGHTFFMFRNADTNELNIVYRRHDDSYGLLVPVN